MILSKGSKILILNHYICALKLIVVCQMIKKTLFITLWAISMAACQKPQDTPTSVVGADVYVVGQQISKATMWKNGVQTELYTGVDNTKANAVFVK